MRSELMGKTLAMFMVIAMIATGIAMLPGVQAGAYLIKGQVLEIESDDPISGVNVFITVDSNPKVYANTTSGTDGSFSKYVDIDSNYTFWINYSKTGFNDELETYSPDLFNGTVADTGVTLLTAKSVVKGTVYEMDTTNPIADVEVNIEGDTETVIATSGTDGRFSAFISDGTVDISFNKDKYYSSIVQSVGVEGTSYDDIYYMEKITPEPTTKVWGWVYNTTYEEKTVSNATVSITEGDEKWITTTSDDDGYYEMWAYPGNYQIKASKDRFFTTFDETYFFTVSTDKSVNEDIVIEYIGNLDYNITVNVNNVMNDAQVYLHSADGRFTAKNTSGTNGNYSLEYYDDTFILQVSKAGYYTDVSTTITSADDDKIFYITLDLITEDFTLNGYVYDVVNEEIIQEATVTLYDEAELYMTSTETGENGYFEFNVSADSDFQIAVDADGFQSELIDLNPITNDERVKVGLYPSEMDNINTTYTLIDWNTIHVSKVKELTVDNISARLNADRKWGMTPPTNLVVNNFDLNASEVSIWEDYLEQKGAEQRDTEDFLTIDNLYYGLNSTTYNVTIEGAEGPVHAANASIYINSTYSYTLVGELEDPDADEFTLVFNASYDSEYEDRINHITLPLDPKFEMTSNVTETNNVEVMGYNDPITIDPFFFEEDSETVTMTLERSMNGTARATIDDSDPFVHVLNSTFDNYTAIVAQGGSIGLDTMVKFSAGDSTDTIGNINEANFTWDFGDGEMGYGMEVEHNFTGAAGDITVNLTVTETGGNKTYRDLYLKVDSQAPSAGISVIATNDNVTLAGTTLTVNEDMSVVFSGLKFSDAEGMGDEVIAGSASSDELEDGDGGEGLIEKWYWSWGEEDSPDETITKEGSNNITHTYSEPGEYILNLITTDVVGHESENATWTVKVLDVEAPAPAFIIQNNESVTVTEVVENNEYTYNASTTADNYDDVDDLTFVWYFEVDGQVTNQTGMVTDYTFTTVGNYNVTLVATDSAGNEANHTQIVHVNLGERPNILMKVGSMSFDPEEGTAGSTVTISVNLTNDGEADASNIQVTFYIRNADGTDTEIGSDSIAALAVGDEASASVDWKPGKKGEYSIWANATSSGEHSSQYWDNKLDDFSMQKISVAEAAWVLPAIVGGIIAVIVVVFFGFRYFMQTGAEAEKPGEKRKKR